MEASKSLALPLHLSGQFQSKGTKWDPASSQVPTFLPYVHQFVKDYIALYDANCLRAAVVLDDSFWPAGIGALLVAAPHEHLIKFH